MPKKRRFLKVLRMDHAIAENDRTPRETLLQNWRASQRPYGEKNNKFSIFDQNQPNGPRSSDFRWTIPNRISGGPLAPTIIPA